MSSTCSQEQVAFTQPIRVNFAKGEEDPAAAACARVEIWVSDQDFPVRVAGVLPSDDMRRQISNYERNDEMITSDGEENLFTEGAHGAHDHFQLAKIWRRKMCLCKSSNIVLIENGQVAAGWVT
jgi:hypothetical protein